MNNSSKHRLGMILYSIGIALLMIILTVSVWSDLEAINIHKSVIRRQVNPNMRCPIFLNNVETGEISIKITNTTDVRKRPQLTTLITQSTLSLLRDERDFLILEPGETVTITREIVPEDSVFDSLILAKFIVDNPYPMADTQNVCGVFVLNTDLISGSQATLLIITLGIILSAAGVLFYRLANRPLAGNVQRQFLVYLGLALAILLVSYLSNIGHFIYGFIGFLIILITIIVLIFGDREFTIKD